MDPVTGAIVSNAGKAIGRRLGEHSADSALQRAVVDACAGAAAGTIKEALNDIEGRKVANELIARMKPWTRMKSLTDCSRANGPMPWGPVSATRHCA